MAAASISPRNTWSRRSACRTSCTGSNTRPISPGSPASCCSSSIYYFGAEAFLIDRDKAPLDPAWAIILSAGSLAAGWFIYDAMCKSPLGQRTGPLAVALFVEIAAFTFFYHGVFSDRAAFLHVGALIGTIMAVSVFAVIIPNQKKVVADLLAGRKPDPALGKQARQRSLHNNYLTLPVVFMMISNHYPIVFGHPWSPLIALGIVVGGALVRHYLQPADAGALDWTAKAAIPAAIALLIVLVDDHRLPARRGVGRRGASPSRTFSRSSKSTASHCHSAQPTQPRFSGSAEGRGLRHAGGDPHATPARSSSRRCSSKIMPLGNETGMTEAERQMLGAWIEGGAPVLQIRIR